MVRVKWIDPDDSVYLELLAGLLAMWKEALVEAAPPPTGTVPVAVEALGSLPLPILGGNDWKFGLYDGGDPWEWHRRCLAGDHDWDPDE